jgi:cysteine synthase A
VKFPHRSDALLSLIGHTPLIPLRFESEGVTILAKAEFLNPSGSVKDRLARSIILDAEERGLLKAGSIILECTSGNTGIALALVGAARGYKVRIVMCSSASVERRTMLRRLGADLVLFESGPSYQTGIDLTLEMAANDPWIFLPRQFENPLNAEDHEHTTGQEIIVQAGGEVHAFVSGFGTGGTIAGVGRALKNRWPGIQVVAMEPSGDAAPGECPCSHRIEGVAQSYEPPLLRMAPIDRRITVSGADAMRMARRLHREFGLLTGTSSGANVVAALEVARELGSNAKVVTILCDRAERYFSTALFSD